MESHGVVILVCVFDGDFPVAVPGFVPGGDVGEVVEVVVGDVVVDGGEVGAESVISVSKRRHGRVAALGGIAGLVGDVVVGVRQRRARGRPQGEQRDVDLGDEHPCRGGGPSLVPDVLDGYLAGPVRDPDVDAEHRHRADRLAGQLGGIAGVRSAAQDHVPVRDVTVVEDDLGPAGRTHADAVPVVRDGETRAVRRQVSGRNEVLLGSEGCLGPDHEVGGERRHSDHQLAP